MYAKAMGPRQQPSQADNLKRQVGALNQLETCCHSLIRMVSYSLPPFLCFSHSSNPFFFPHSLFILCCPSFASFSWGDVHIPQCFLSFPAFFPAFPWTVYHFRCCRSPVCHHAFASLCTLSFITPLLTRKRKKAYRSKEINNFSFLFISGFVSEFFIYLSYF